MPQAAVRAKHRREQAERVASVKRPRSRSRRIVARITRKK